MTVSYALVMKVSNTIIMMTYMTNEEKNLLMTWIVHSVKCQINKMNATLHRKIQMDSNISKVIKYFGKVRYRVMYKLRNRLNSYNNNKKSPPKFSFTNKIFISYMIFWKQAVASELIGGCALTVYSGTLVSLPHPKCGPCPLSPIRVLAHGKCKDRMG